MGILDTIIDSKHESLKQNFDPLGLVARILEHLKERDKSIVSRRYGLSGHDATTLEHIGADLKLTRERVRQIEKQLLLDLKKRVKDLDDFQAHSEVLHGALVSHGGLMAEADLLETVGIRAIAESNAVRFLMVLIEGVEEIKKHKLVKDGWKTIGFDEKVFQAFSEAVHDILRATERPHGLEALLDLVKKTEVYGVHGHRLSDQVMNNFLKVLKTLDKNPLDEYGFGHWSEVSPKDVGDKAYLALRNFGKPAHYRDITHMINDLGFAGHKAHDETVHNELIKDKRFVLVGRGMYALTDWGYKPGVVSDVIVEILKEAAKPLSKDAIIEAVGKKRMVKRNTILVSLADKKRFAKVGSEYTLIA